MITLVPGASQAANTGKIVQPSGIVNSPFTGFSAQAPATASGALVTNIGTANQYLIVIPIASSPYIKADLYDSNIRKLTALTISGALGEVLYSGSNTMAECSIAYSSGQAKAYIKGANTAVHKVYPLSLSGTTLTVGTAIDISATYAAGKADEVLMTSDLTDLYFIDVSGANGPKKYTLPSGGFGSALATPTNTNYYQATSSVNYNHHFFYSNGKIYMLSSGTDKGPPAVFQEYSIAGNSWTDKGVPPPLLSNACACIIPVFDPSNNTYLYFVQLPTADNATRAMSEANVARWKSSDNTSEIYCFLMQWESAGDFNTNALVSQGFPTSGTCPNHFSRSGCMSVTNNDMVFVTQAASAAGDVFNIGKKWGRSTLYTYTGSGILKGFAAPAYRPVALVSSTSGLKQNAPVTFIITIDGDSTDRISSVIGNDVTDSLNNINLSFSTSITIEVVGAYHNVISSYARRISAIARLLLFS